MRCNRCRLETVQLFDSEVAIHFSGVADLSKSAVLVFPKLTVCLRCGLSEFTIPETELRSLDGGG